MKKSKTITLVLITAALASCNKEKPESEWSGPKVYMRSDSTAAYTRTHHYYGVGSALLWYYAFRPYRGYAGGQYGRAGYYSSGIHERSNIGHNTTKSSIVRGGFGRGSSVSS
jgi:hypothetical protein